MPEECDDGENGDNTDACIEGCLRATCGDGFVWTGVEECDDGNDVNDDGCSNTCHEPACGDAIVQEGEDCDNGLNNSNNSSCSPDCTFTASAGMLSLDWDYVCSDHIPFSTKSYRIRGLENGKEYNFMLVPYDLIGNPAPVTTIARGIPVETYDLWEQCEEDGGICGASGYCNVSDDSSGGLALFSALAAFGLGGLGVANRRRNRA
jgi:cysteine-rich repeat protein